MKEKDKELGKNVLKHYTKKIHKKPKILQHKILKIKLIKFKTYLIILKNRMMWLKNKLMLWKMKLLHLIKNAEKEE